MKYILLSAGIINSVIGAYNMFFASMIWGVFNFLAAGFCIYSYLHPEE
jgi:hypothetical protein